MKQTIPAINFWRCVCVLLFLPVSLSFLATSTEKVRIGYSVVHASDAVPDSSRIQGCSLLLNEGSTTNYTVTIDGVQADLGRFSDAIYKKLCEDAKQQRFQGFRPGTIPPHLQPTYRAFAMDECARETVLEALQQNDVRPFEAARSEMSFDTFCIPPAKVSKKKKKKRKGRKENAEDEEDGVDTVDNQWRTFATMKEALDAGWRPGQSFSFVARNVKGQKLKSVEAGSQPLSRSF